MVGTCPAATARVQCIMLPQQQRDLKHHATAPRIVQPANTATLGAHAMHYAPATAAAAPAATAAAVPAAATVTA